MFVRKFSFDFDYDDFSLVLKSIFTRIDFVSDILSDCKTDDCTKVREYYVNELSSLRALLEKLMSSK